MKRNIENCINQVCNLMGKGHGEYKHAIQELVNNLKEVKVAHKKGRSKQVLDEFFKLYVFNKSEF